MKRLYLIALLPFSAFAEGWSGEGELGYTNASGNTESENLVASLGLNKQVDVWKHTASLEVLKASANNVTSADSLTLKAKSEYSFSEHSYWFGRFRYENDEFSGFDRQISVSFGAGSRFIDNEVHVLDLDAGVGIQKARVASSGEDNSEAVITADLVYSWQISETSEFSEQFSVEITDDNTHSESETALKTKIHDNLSSKLSFLVKHDSDAPVNTDSTDRILTVSVVYSF